MLDLTVCLDPEAEAPLYQQLYASVSYTHLTLPTKA